MPQARQLLIHKSRIENYKVGGLGKRFHVIQKQYIFNVLFLTKPCNVGFVVAQVYHDQVIVTGEELHHAVSKGVFKDQQGLALPV